MKLSEYDASEEEFFIFDVKDLFLNDLNRR